MFNPVLPISIMFACLILTKMYVYCGKLEEKVPSTTKLVLETSVKICPSLDLVSPYLPSPVSLAI